MNNFEAPVMQATGITTPEAKIKKSGIKTAQDIFEMYEKEDQKISTDEFADVYSMEEIQKDKERVAYFKNSKEYEKPTEHGIVLENMFCDLAERFEWFGTGSKIVQLSEFDDMSASGAHCDAVLEVPMESGFIMRVGIDLTTATNYDTLSKKRTKCLEGVLNGNFFSVKYFKSKVDDTKGRIQNIPVLFAGMNKENVEALCASVAKQENIRNDSLKKHEAQFRFLDQLVSQLESYLGTAVTKHGSEGSVTAWLDYYKKVFEWIGENRKSLRPNNFEQKASMDEVYKYVTRFV